MTIYEPMLPPTFDLSERIAAHVVTAHGGCMEWNGSRDGRGYALISVHDRTRRVSRLVWELTNGPIPEGLHVLHRCDNPPCVALEHLFLGTPADNAHDRDAKGRGKPPSHLGYPSPNTRGEKNVNAKLTIAQVSEIRERHRSGASTAQMARDYLVGESTVRHVLKGISWRWVE